MHRIAIYLGNWWTFFTEQYRCHVGVESTFHLQCNVAEEPWM